MHSGHFLDNIKLLPKIKKLLKNWKTIMMKMILWIRKCICKLRFTNHYHPDDTVRH